MKQQKLTEISRVSGKSVSTVSKVLRGCGGVDADTRETVLRAASLTGGALYEPSKQDVFVILPDNPKYFWHKACAEIQKSRLSVTLKFFSAIRKEQGEALLERYIEEATETGARALILAAHLPERLRRRVEELACRMLVIQLCEYTPSVNTFFVGSDGRQDGRALASAIQGVVDRPLHIGVMTGAVSHASIERVEGFVQGLPDHARLFYVEKPTVIELYASHLARRIDALGVPLDYFFCFDGITTAACDALYKLRSKMDTRLIGFEYPPTAQKHAEAGRIAALAVQAPDRQMQRALALAERYVKNRLFPDQKYCYVPSRIYRGEKGNA